MMNLRHDRPKILLVSSKWPSSSDSIDGGDVTLREIIIAIKGSCVVDLLCFRNDVASNVRLDGVRKVYVCRADFAGYDTYSSREEEKFNLRIDQAGFAAHEIERIAGRYDRVVIVHARFLLGVSPSSELWQKCVLFPMFTGTSYSYAGEKVPARYFDLEKSAFSRVACFVTPSMLERRMLLCQYGVPESRVHVIERPVHVGFVERTFCRKEILIVYIASIRIQKNHMAAMTLVKELSRRCLNVRLLCVGAIQDEMIHQECLRYLQKHSLEQRVEFCGSLRHSEVEKVMRSADFNISVSRWETFGRGIYEGIAAGIPTIALNTLRPLVESMFMPVAPALVDNVEKMADMICALQRDPCKYRDVSSKGECLQRYLNLDRIGLRLNDAILSGGNEGRLVLVPERDLLSTHGTGVLNDAKRLFLSKSFVKLVELLQDSDGVPAADLLAVKGNLALGYHLLGEREKAEALYGYAQEREIAVANRLAFFHRYFDYTSANCCVRPDMGRISELVSHNMVNFHIVDSGVDSYVQATGPFAYFSEQILNYVRERRGENLVLKENEKMCRAFAESVQIEKKKRFAHARRRVGFFVTDIQRHQESAMLFEMVGLLSDECDLYIYFNNIFENKLSLRLKDFVQFRRVIVCSMDELNNHIFDDEIEILVDCAEYGLRNNNVALSLLVNVIPLSELLVRFPLLLSSKMYFADDVGKSAADRSACIGIFGDLRCITDDELVRIRDLMSTGESVVFVSHAFNEAVFERYFRSKLRAISYRESEIRIRRGIRPFAKYMLYLRQCRAAVFVNGASVVQVAEAVHAGIPIAITSSNRVIRSFGKYYGLSASFDAKIRWGKPIDPISQSLACGEKFVKHILESPSACLCKLNKIGLRMAYASAGRLFAVHETCNGDVIAFDDGESSR